MGGEDDVCRQLFVHLSDHRSVCHLYVLFAGVKLVMEATCIMFDEKPKMVDDPNKMGKKIANYW